MQWANQKSRHLGEAPCSLNQKYCILEHVTVSRSPTPCQIRRHMECGPAVAGTPLFYPARLDAPRWVLPTVPQRQGMRHVCRVYPPCLTWLRRKSVSNIPIFLCLRSSPDGRLNNKQYLSSPWLFPSPGNRSVYFGHGIPVVEIYATFAFPLLLFSVPQCLCGESSFDWLFRGSVLSVGRMCGNAPSP
jgi:hypothetical protein